MTVVRSKQPFCPFRRTLTVRLSNTKSMLVAMGQLSFYLKNLIPLQMNVLFKRIKAH